MLRLATVTAGAVLCLARSAFAQVRYLPYPGVDAFVPTPYGYPVPGGFLQPNETLGTSPSFVVPPYAGVPAVQVVRRCQYPDGWNVTDFSRDVNGVPNGSDHACPAPISARIRARY